MSPLDWIIEPLRRYTDFSGRSRRREFWWFMLVYWAILLALMAAVFAAFPWNALEGRGDDLQSLVDAFQTPLMLVSLSALGLFYIGTYIPYVALVIRRLHDRNMSGWWYGAALILSWIPFLSLFSFLLYPIIFVIMWLSGTKGPNRFGPDPKDSSQAAVFE